MKLPNIYTITTKSVNDDMPITAVLLNLKDLIAEINCQVVENEEIGEIFRDAFNGYFEEISSADVRDMENPILAYLEAKYRILNKDFTGNDIPNEFIEDEFRNGMLFNSDDTNTFMDITCHEPRLEGNTISYQQV